MNSKWLWLLAGIMLGYFVGPMLLSKIAGLTSQGT